MDRIGKNQQDSLMASNLHRLRRTGPGYLSVALITASALLCAGMPARAFPNARVNLIRISSEGVTAMPGLQQAKLLGPPPEAAQIPLLSQSQLASGESPTLLTKASDPLVMSFADSLPSFEVDDYISIRIKSNDSSNGVEVEQIRFDSSAVVISPDRRTITITPRQPLQAGQTLAALLPTGNYVLPVGTSSCFFELAPPVAVTPPGLPPAAAAAAVAFPIVPVILGIGAAALIGCAIGGCFNGEGGRNQSSN
ncbi:hypothetical protein KQ307_02300 [Synechococcus sp. CS-1326]|uniref:hypothetical protein n=3 Tax=unclassified Synechococcus TaxID=2626047 RepID=UPI00223C47E3|nr:hypothetical protein [Synechococcus sp. CS-1326]MCT0212337.1 hypothetical protein [Synechococcus sp. CS-1326]